MPTDDSQPETPVNSDIGTERITDIIDFCVKTEKLRKKPVANVSSYRLFTLFEKDIADLPGITLDPQNSEEEELWLKIDRLQETPPPEVKDCWLRPWIQVPNNPEKKASLIKDVAGINLINAGTHVPKGSGQRGLEIDPNELVKYEDYAEKNKVTQLFEKYLKDEWDLWAKDEIPKRKTIKIYHDLFTLDQQLVSGITEEQIELVWGSGVCVWKKDSVEFKYPLLTRNIGISLNPLTSELTVKASDSEPNVELEWHESQDNPGVPNVGSEAKSFFGSEKGFFTPFDVSNYQSLLKSASAHLDPNGVYWPDEVGENDKELPAADDRLKVTSTWVIFARPRTGNLLLKDLEKLREQAVKSESLPPAVKELVTDPSEDSEDLPLPPFRGVSASYHLEEKPGSGGDEASDLFFPKPFNDEQVRIVQLLDVYNGVVVQGPPGTGKTHTIANVICHYLAMGKRVLVTSMKDPALSVLRNQLPAEIRTLAISLLSTEQDGMKNFEHAIEKIASNVQSINKSDQKKKIRILETKINKLHRTLSGIDRKIIELGRTNLTSIKISGEEIQPEEAAKEVVLNAEQYEWIRDEINVGDEYDPQFTDEQVSQLRNARFQLREDINYHNAVLPSLNDLPEIDSIIRLHQDLKNFDQLKKEVESGKVLSLVDTSEGTIHGLSLLRNKLDELKEVRDIVEQYRSKVSAIKANLSDTLKTNVIEVIQECGKEAKELEEENQAFRVRPVVVPEGVETNQDILSAISKLSVEEKPFGILGFIGHSKEKEILKSITVFDVAPKNSDDWKHVEKFLRYQEMLRKLAIKWNHSATELSLEPVEISPQGGARVIKEFLFFQYAEREKKLEEVVVSTAKEIFPRWVAIAPSNFNWEVFWRLYEAVKHHLAKEKLKDVWLQKERLRDAFTDNSGAVVDSFKQLIDESLGADSVPDADFQNEWTRLRDELNRIHDLEPILSELKTTVNLIRSSGASSYAEELLKPLEGEVDSLLPMNWRECWDLKRLSTHLSEVDKDSDLGDIAEKRREADEQLKRAYQEVIEMKTWLKLSENASDKVKAALQGYLAAIRQIGKGTGKRALRYRHDARMAATDANPAVPCWIMPHWRVSETLPAELGCFDLVIIDEASQSDLTALPALLRAKKVLVVGDDKQVSPEGIGMKEDAIKSIMTQLLGKQVPQYKAQMSPERSIYDLFKVVYAKSSVMLKEHFRCVQPIIEYSKREFYDHELKPLRVPQASERIDPPLVDVFVKDGYRSNDKTNIPEAEYIVDEIKKLTSDEKLKGRSIGIVSLLGQDQSILIWQMICNEIDPQVIRSHDIICGDAYSFQGKERDIMFLSMVADREKKSPLVGKTFPKRFNVAASRARDRMYLVRSVETEDLSISDGCRISLINHFSKPFSQDEKRVSSLRELCESEFEKEVYDALTEKGYWVTPQVKVGSYRIDLVVEGDNDSRIAVECDGDRYHGPEKWPEDMNRQRILERAGWTFFRFFASAWHRHRKDIMRNLEETLSEAGIKPIEGESRNKSPHTELREIESPENEEEEANSHTLDVLGDAEQDTFNLSGN